jgi:hypothetical protein
MAPRDPITVTISVCGSQAQLGRLHRRLGPTLVAVGPTAAVVPDGLVAAVLTVDRPAQAPRPGFRQGCRAAAHVWPRRIGHLVLLVTPDHLGQYTLTVHLTLQHGFTAVALPEQAITIPPSVHEPRDVAGSSIVDTFRDRAVVAGLVVPTRAVRASICRRRRPTSALPMSPRADPAGRVPHDQVQPGLRHLTAARFTASGRVRQCVAIPCRTRPARSVIHFGKCRQPIAIDLSRWLAFVGIARPHIADAPSVDAVACPQRIRRSRRSHPTLHALNP